MKAILDFPLYKAVNFLMYFAFLGFIFVFAMKIYHEGYDNGFASGYLAGMNSKKPRPKVIVITPRCTDIPMFKADSLWRI